MDVFILKMLEILVCFTLSEKELPAHQHKIYYEDICIETNSIETACLTCICHVSSCKVPSVPLTHSHQYKRDTQVLEKTINVSSHDVSESLTFQLTQTVNVSVCVAQVMLEVQ